MTILEQVKTSLSIYFFIYTTFFFFLQYAVVKHINYYDLRKTLPLIFFFSSHFTLKGLKLRKIVYPATISLIAGFLIFNYQWDWLGGMQFAKQLIGVPWEHWVFVEYLLFGLVYFELWSRKFKHDFKALAYTFLLLPIVGFMYEIPTYHLYSSVEWYSLGCPFIIRTSILCLFLVCYKLGWQTFKDRKVILAIALLSLFYLFHFLNPFFAFPRHVWLVRIPTGLFWAVTVYSWKGERNNL